MGENEDVAFSPSGMPAMFGDAEEELTLFEDTENVPGAVELSLMLNQQYQKVLRETIAKLQRILNHNLAEQQRIIDFEAGSKEVQYKNTLMMYRKPITLFAFPYFRDVRGFIPPENEDAITKKHCNDVDAYLQPLRPWTTKEHERLKESVYLNALQQAITPLQSTISSCERKIALDLLEPAEEEKLKELIKTSEENIENMKRKPKEDLVEMFKDSIDWLQISSAYMGGTRTAEDCQCLWENYLNPKVNKHKFKPSEDNKLKELALYYKGRKWSIIAEQLGTGRSPIQCLERYQTRHNEKILRVFWTKEEDKRLLKAVSACRIGNYIPWHQVVNYMDGRTRIQVTNRWVRVVAPGLKMGPFSKEEDALLLAAVTKYGNYWKKVIEFLPWRAAHACRERYTNFLVPTVITGGWRYEEDLELMNQIAIYGEGKWSKICRGLPGRTDAMCYQRALVLKRHNLALYKRLTNREEAPEKNLAFPKGRFAPSRICDNQNATRRSYYEAALESYNLSVMEISGVMDISRLPKNEAGVAVPSVKLLKTMQEELKNSGYLNKLKDFKPDYDYGETHNQLLAKKQYEQIYDNECNLGPELVDVSETDSDVEFIEEAEASSDDESKKEEEEEIDRRLDFLFAPRAAAGIKIRARKKLSHCVKEEVEYRTLKSILFQDFGVPDDRTSEDADANSTFYKEIDFSETLPSVLRMFMMPSCEPGCLPVVPPNVANLSAMLTYLVSRRQMLPCLQELSSDAVHVMKAISFDKPNFDRRCASCQKSSFGEKGTSSEKSHQCYCDTVKRLRERYLLLRKRCISLFLWPMMLANIQISQGQVESLLNHRKLGEDKVEKPRLKSPSKRRRRKKKRKRSCSSSDDDDDNERLLEEIRQEKKTKWIQTRTRRVRWMSNWQSECEESTEGHNSEELNMDHQEAETADNTCTSLEKMS